MRKQIRGSSNGRTQLFGSWNFGSSPNPRAKKFIDKKAFEKVLKISEEFFGTQNDPNQMPINQDSADKLQSIHKDTIIYKFNGKGDPILGMNYKNHILLFN